MITCALDGRQKKLLTSGKDIHLVELGKKSLSYKMRFVVNVLTFEYIRVIFDRNKPILVQPMNMVSSFRYYEKSYRLKELWK